MGKLGTFKRYPSTISARKCRRVKASAFASPPPSAPPAHNPSLGRPSGPILTALHLRRFLTAGAANQQQTTKQTKTKQQNNTLEHAVHRFHRQDEHQHRHCHRHQHHRHRRRHDRQRHHQERQHHHRRVPPRFTPPSLGCVSKKLGFRPPRLRPFLHGLLLTETGRGDGSASRYGTRRAFILVRWSHAP